MLGHRGRRAAHQDCAKQRNADGNSADIEVAIGKFLGDHAGRNAGYAEPAEFFRKISAQKSESPHFANEFSIHNPCGLPRLVVRGQALFRETAREIPDGELVFVEDHARWFLFSRATADVSRAIS